MPGSGSGSGKSSKSSGRGSGGSGKSVNKPGRPQRTGKRKEPGGASTSAVIDLAVDLTAGPAPRLRREASAAANREAETIVDLVGPARRSGGRRNAPLVDTHLIVAHGEVGDRSQIVPPGYTLVFVSQLGSLSSGELDDLMMSTEDVQRMIVGRHTPRGRRMALDRYDAGHRYPDMALEDETGPGWKSGVWRLPLKPSNFKRVSVPQGEGWIEKDDKGKNVIGADGRPELQAELVRHRWTLSVGALRPIAPSPPARRWLSEMLGTLPKGKYIVSACREFAGCVPEDRRRSLIALENAREERKRTGARSDPGSLSDTDITRPLPTRISQQSLQKHYKKRKRAQAPVEHLMLDPPVAEVSRHRRRGVKGSRGAKAIPASPENSDVDIGS